MSEKVGDGSSCGDDHAAEGWRRHVRLECHEDFLDLEKVRGLHRQGASCIALRSGMGTGKSTLIAKLVGRPIDEGVGSSLEEQEGGGGPRKLKVLAIAPRRLLATFLAKRYELDDYQESRGSLYGKDRVVVQLESLHRLLEGGANGRCPVVEVLLLDELESLLGHFRSETVSRTGKRRLLFNLLCHFVRTAEKVYVADAFLGDRGVGFLLRCGVEPWVYWNRKKMASEDANRVVNHPTVDGWMKELEDHIRTEARKGAEEGRTPIAILSNRNEKLKEIHAFILSVDPGLEEKEGRGILLLNSECGEAEKRLVHECNRRWKGLRYLLASPTLGPGVDFSESHFARMFLYATPASCPPLDTLQMTGRVRHLTERIIHLFVEQASRSYVPPLPASREEIRAMIERREALLPNPGKDALRDQIVKGEDGEYRHVVEQDDYLELYIDNVAEEFRGRNRYAQELRSGFEEQGSIWVERQAPPTATTRMTKAKRRSLEESESKVLKKRKGCPLSAQSPEVRSFCKLSSDALTDDELGSKFLNRFFPDASIGRAFSKQILFEAAFLKDPGEIFSEEVRVRGNSDHSVHTSSRSSKLSFLRDLFEVLGWKERKKEGGSSAIDLCLPLHFSLRGLLETSRPFVNGGTTTALQELQSLFVGDRAFLLFDNQPALAKPSEQSEPGRSMGELASRVRAVLAEFGMVLVSHNDKRGCKKLPTDLSGVICPGTAAKRVNDLAYSVDLDWIRGRLELAKRRGSSGATGLLNALGLTTKPWEYARLFPDQEESLPTERSRGFRA